MSKLKPLIPIDQQIENFKFQFAAYKEWTAFCELHPSTGYDANRVPRNEEERRLKEMGWDYSRWVWDEEWDGKLVANLQSLDAAGFEIQKFYRKRKIEFRWPRDTKDRTEILNRVMKAVGDDWEGIKFIRTGISIWWKGGSPWKSYRP